MEQHSTSLPEEAFEKTPSNSFVSAAVTSSASSDGAEAGRDRSSDRFAATSSAASSAAAAGNEEADDDDDLMPHTTDGVSSTSAGGPSPPLDAEGEGAMMAASAAAARPAAVGLVNEGCTCYLNSLLQLLFHTGYFRTAVYQIPVEGDDGPSVYKALQETFFQMQERTTPARTTTLTNAFGWGKRELYVQHDIQEMATLLRDNLEERMKGTVTEGAINQLFEGRGEQFVETLDKSYVSRRADTYYDIHIPLGQHHTLLDSLTSLTARDQLVGDNKYRVERDGQPAVYMDAEKGYSYTRFPAVTWFHLKRFAMDLTSPTLEMRKVNAPLEFPVELDLRTLEKPEDRADASSAPPTKVGSAVVPFSTDSPAVYDLQGVIVHRGTVRSGHYYCYIREWDAEERRFGRWLEYDDETVREVPEDVAVRANYGKSAPVDSFRHDASMMGGANAYILSYVRRADAPAILAPSPTDIVSDRVKEALRRAIQEEEQQLREAEEARMSASLCCLTDATLNAYCNSVCSTELYTRDSHQWRRTAECVVTVRKSNTMMEVYEALAAQPALAKRGVTATSIRLWRCTDAAALRPTIALPTYAEAVAHTLNGAQPPECLGDFLTTEENKAALTICMYLDQAKPPLLGLQGLTGETSLIESVKADATTRCYTVRLARATEAKALHITLDSCDYATTVEYTVTTDKETLPAAMVTVTAGDSVVELPLNELRRTLEVEVRVYVPSMRHGSVRDVHLELPHGHPLLHASSNTASAAAASLLPVLPSIGYDRALVFFKYYDYATNTMQYVGSRLLDRAAKVYACAAVYRDALGLSDIDGAATAVAVVDPAPTASPSDGSAPTSSGKPPHSHSQTHHHEQQQQQQQQQQPPPPSMFRYFIERGDHTPIEIHEHCDLAEFKSGTVIVAQLRNIPAPYRTLSVKNFYRDSRNSLDAQVMEVRRSHQMNDDAYRTTTLELQKAAVAAAKTAAAKLSAGQSKTGGAAPPTDASLPSGRHGSTSSTTTTTTTMAHLDGERQVDAKGGATPPVSTNTLDTTVGGATESAKTLGDALPSSVMGSAGPSSVGLATTNATTAHEEASHTGAPPPLSSSTSSTAAAAPVNAQHTSAVAAFTAAAESDPTRIAAFLNPYEAVRLPTLHEIAVERLPVENFCRLLSSWSYEAVCSAIGRVIGYDPSHLQLYQNCSTGEPMPDTVPAHCSSTVTVMDLLYLDAYNPTSVLFYERLPIPREQQQSMGVVTVTLRDRAGYALHRESFTVKLATVTCQGLVRLLRQSLPDWQREADPWGSVADTLQATHYVMSCVDMSRHQIAFFHEVPMDVEAEDEVTVDAAWLRRFDVELQAAAPLHGTQRRIACCHMNYDAADRSATSQQQQQRCAFGQPFLIVIDATTTVTDARDIMLRTTHLPEEVLQNSHGYGVMMVAGQIYHFEDWRELVHLYWVHTRNSSSYVPSLMMNHAKPREKPGSRYVAQHNPQLKISNK